MPAEAACEAEFHRAAAAADRGAAVITGTGLGGGGFITAASPAPLDVRGEVDPLEGDCGSGEDFRAVGTRSLSVSGDADTDRTPWPRRFSRWAIVASSS